MDSSKSAWLYIGIVAYIICLYYSEVDCPNSFYNENKKLISGGKWFFLFAIIICELSIAYTYGFNKDNMDVQNLKILFAVMLTWFFLFIPTIYLYYYEKDGTYNGKPSVYLNSIFENSIGYLFVKNEANTILSKLNIGIFENSDQVVKDMEQIVIEINKSRAIFINQLTIFNFDKVWNKLFSPIFSTINKTENDDNKDKLLNLVKKKYIIGKCIWFLYNSIMCLSISLYLLVI
jgi:hypothetical protein